MDRPDPVPDLDLEPKRARALIDAAADIYQEFLERLPDLPVDRRRSVPEVRELVAIDIPYEGLSDEELIDYLRTVVFDASMYIGHPGFMAYVVGAGTVTGAVADLVASGINQNVGGWRLAPGATEIELHLTRWFARLFGLPEEAGGLVTSGGSMANFIALKVARDRILGLETRQRGLAGARLTAYTSDEVHFAMTRAADMLGLGSDAVRRIPPDHAYKLDIARTEARIRADLDDGYQPFTIIASAGTVATGAMDPLDEIADLCERYGMWFHVDGAYGGPAILAEDLKPLFAGIERADSLAFDPHKWLYTPQSGGVVLVRDLKWLAESFGTEAAYIYEDKDLTGHGLDFGMFGPQLSRSFWALKIFVSLLAHGTHAYAARISHDAELARYLSARATDHEEFEVMAPVELSICCFRYVPSGLPDTEGRDRYLDLLNQRLMAEVQMDGRTYYSNAVLHGRFVLRCCIVNYRTEAKHIDQVLDVTAELGARLDAEMRPESLRA
jgi:glutamate/tyrosine decarboxylase-like PLP-dependent enzyme